MQQALAFEQLQTKIDSYRNEESKLVNEINLFNWYLDDLRNEPRKNARLISAVSEKIQSLEDSVFWIRRKINDRETMQMLVEQVSIRLARFEQRAGANFAEYTEGMSEREIKRQLRLLDEDRQDINYPLEYIKEIVMKKREKHYDDTDLRQICRIKDF